jgi:RHS repeat-associated protein
VLTSSWTSTSDTYDWSYLFQGGRYDATSELYDFRNREYSPALGRWLEQDPAGYVDGASLYQFVRSRPIDLVDPLGLQTDPDRKNREMRDLQHIRITRPGTRIAEDGQIQLDYYRPRNAPPGYRVVTGPGLTNKELAEVMIATIVTAVGGIAFDYFAYFDKMKAKLQKVLGAPPGRLMPGVPGPATGAGLGDGAIVVPEPQGGVGGGMQRPWTGSPSGPD